MDLQRSSVGTTNLVENISDCDNFVPNLPIFGPHSCHCKYKFLETHIVPSIVLEDSLFAAGISLDGETFRQL